MNNLKIGQVFRNYKAICEWLDVKPASGNTKISHMKDFDRYCKYHKDGNKFVIDEVYDMPLERENNRYLIEKEYIVESQSNRLNGVYTIALDDSLYIGSTISGFRGRFHQHKFGSQRHTKEMLDKGALFQVLWGSEVEDEYIIREAEQMYIDYFMANKDWNLVNKKEETICLSEKKKKYKNKTIKIDERQYELALQILKDNGIMIEGDK